MKITFANLGNYSVCFKTLLENLGAEVIAPEKTNPNAIKEGVKLSPELFCFPLKVNIGNYLSAIKNGADTVFMWENIGGSCRLRYYWIIQKKVLNEAGFDIDVLNLNARNFLSKINQIRKENGISIIQAVKTFFFFLKEIKFIEKLEGKANFLRPREKIQGKTDQILIEALERLEQIKNSNDLRKLETEIWRKFSQIEIDGKLKPLEVGLIGEIYTVIDGAVNFDVERKLGKMGVEVHRQMNLFYHLKKTIFPWIDWKIQQKIMPYLRSTVGGHGRDAVYEMLDYAQRRFGGVIQLLPFGCLPETTVRPILQKISQEKNIPFLSFSIDEQTGEVGVQTRLEAFVDLIKSREKSKIA